MNTTNTTQKTFVYIRVSSADQNEARQVDELASFAESERDIFIEKCSGKDFNRPEYQRMKAGLRAGDTVVVKSIDRLGRNYSEIKREWESITKDLGCNINVTDMPLLNTTVNQIDGLTGTFIADLVLEVLAYVAQKERENIKRRQAEGIQSAQQRGIKLGRPAISKPDNWSEVYPLWTTGAITAVEAMKRLNLKPNTFYKLAASI